MRRLVTHLLLLEVLALFALPQGALAQGSARTALEEVDPDVAEGDPGAFDEAPDPDLPPLPPQAAPAAAKGTAPVEEVVAKPRAEAPRTAPLPAPAAPKKPVPVRVSTRTDGDLLTAWAAWRKADAELDREGAEAALAQVTALRAELGIDSLESFSVALARAADRRMRSGDDVGAVELAMAGRDLSPHLPFARFALASAYFRSSPAEVGRWGPALLETLAAVRDDPRYLRPAVSDLVTALLVALVATAVVVVVTLFARRARYFLHDFHHLFPRGAARWQTVPVAALLLGLPVVFRMGVVPVLLALFLAVTLYLDWKERIVAAVAISLVGFVPLFARTTVDWNTFSGTRAEQLHQIEAGGPDAAPAVQAVRARVQQGLAEYPELFALGRYELRRGRLDAATALFKKAALTRGEDPRLLVNLGNARFGLNDLEGAVAHYSRAAALDPTLPAAFHDLAQVHYRRAAVLDEVPRALELDKAQTAQAAAQDLDPTLLSRPEPDADADLNALVLGAPLTWDELDSLARADASAERVADQLAHRIIGMAAGPLTYLLPLVLAGLVLGVGGLRWSVLASSGCKKCGLPVCARCDKGLNPIGGLCSQCVSVFSRRNAVAPQVKVRKQLEVSRHQLRGERISWVAGLLCSGAGHLFGGLPVRGALLTLGFSFALSVALFRDGMLRAPHGELPAAFRLVPAALVLGAVYFLSIRSLRKAQVG